jgi:hypothetical protein
MVWNWPGYGVDKVLILNFLTFTRLFDMATESLDGPSGHFNCHLSHTHTKPLYSMLDHCQHILNTSIWSLRTIKVNTTKNKINICPNN